MSRTSPRRLRRGQTDAANPIVGDLTYERVHERFTFSVAADATGGPRLFDLEDAGSSALPRDLLDGECRRVAILVARTAASTSPLRPTLSVEACVALDVGEQPPRAELRRRLRRGRGQYGVPVVQFKTVKGYSAAAALAYARSYWDRAASDLYIATNQNPPYTAVKSGTHFEHYFDNGAREHAERAVFNNAVVLEWAPMFDCAHFLSCCVGQPGGGLVLGRDFPQGPYGRLGVQRLLDDLTRLGATIISEKTSDKTKIAQVNPGDVICYWNGSRYNHSALYLGSGIIACHTYARSDAHSQWPMEWDSAGKIYTFLRLT